MNYIVPEYYKNFNCKCGECRHSCCEGWPISISRAEYFHLLGMECSDTLRTKLDCALKMSHEPSVESFAHISTNWLGVCMLHREDGLCALQTELGENNLPEVCRRYPRKAIQLSYHSECSCSNSCEEVVELLMKLNAPLQFEEEHFLLHPEFDINISDEKYEMCKRSIKYIQNRELSLKERFFTLGNYLHGPYLNQERPVNLLTAFQLLLDLNLYFDYSISIRDYTKATLNYFGMEDKDTLTSEDMISITNKYHSASEHLESLFPDWQILFEQLIVNHMFYNSFPFSDNQDNTNDAFLSLVIMYSFLRFNFLGYMSDKTDLDGLVDYFASMFRLIEHSNFKYITVTLFKKEKYLVQECIPQLLFL